MSTLMHHASVQHHCGSLLVHFILCSHHHKNRQRTDKMTPPGVMIQYAVLSMFGAWNFMFYAGLSHHTTCPLDPIPSHLLQAISPTLLPALTHIINTSLLTGIFPTAFKQARVTPLLKKPTLNTSLIENYRPVSFLPLIAKTLERVIFNQLS